MEEIFKDYKLHKKSFKHPLQNPCFRYYLVYINKSYDFTNLCENDDYLKNAYNDYFDYLVCECYRPKYPPDIKVEDYILSFDNAFTVYQRYLIKHMERLGLSLTSLDLSSLARHLWDSEQLEVTSYYEKLSIKLKIIYNKKLLLSNLSNLSQNIGIKRKQQLLDDYNNADSISQNNKIQYIDQDNKRPRIDPLNLDLEYFSIQELIN